MEELITSYEALRNNVCMIGICGIGGFGKATLAKVVYEILHDHFEGSSFIANAREYSEKLDLLQLQQLLLADILEERNIEIRNVYHRVNMIKTRLCHKKVLIVLDEVNKLDQLENLAGEHGWFGPGSLIIITTRDEHLLVHHGVHKICKPNPLNSDDALRLFCLKGFKNEQPKEDYLQLSQDVVRYANGYPLALITFGSFLFGRTMDMWKSALDGFKKIPKKEIFDTVKVSYDDLEEMWKDIFLDVACFFRGKMKDEVIEILETCGFDAKIGIQVPVDNSLLTIENNKLQMHVLLQEMGMEIVRRESREEPGKRSRLWLHKDLFHVLMNNTASKTIQAIVLDLIGGDEAYQHVESYSKVFPKMCNLRLLIIDNVHILNGLNHLSNELRFLEWHGYSSKCLPSKFQSKELVELKLRFSIIEYLWRGVKYLDKLKLINLEYSINLNRTPDFTGVPRLKILCLSGCINLVEIHPSIGQLSKLTVLNLESCQSLINLPSSMDGLRSLEKLILSGCSKLSNLPENLGKIKCLKELDLTGTAIREVPSSISFLICHGCENKIFKSRLDSVPHEFENSAVVKATKIMRTYDDSNEAECSASWSFPEETERDLATWSSALSFSDIDSEKKIIDSEANDPDIDFEKVSKGEQVQSSKTALCGASSHRKSSRANYDKFSKQLRKVELAIKELKKDQLDMKEIDEEVMKIEWFDEVMLASAFDYLVDNERVAKAFMVKNARLRSLWLENFFKKNDRYGN